MPSFFTLLYTIISIHPQSSPYLRIETLPITRTVFCGLLFIFFIIAQIDRNLYKNFLFLLLVFPYVTFEIFFH